jgi:hypothetical protein
MTDDKRCPRCKQVLPLSDFRIRKSGRQVGQPAGYCKMCSANHRLDWSHVTGEYRPLAEARDSPCYLGVFVAEKALSEFFDNIQRMPYGNPGYDFLCGKGYKIDVKSACRHNHFKEGWEDFWPFHIRQNKIADYFLCLGFDNLTSLNPEHVWLIPGHVVNRKMGIAISESRLAKWSEYEKPLDKVIACCHQLKAVI